LHVRHAADRTCTPSQTEEFWDACQRLVADIQKQMDEINQSETENSFRSRAQSLQQKELKILLVVLKYVYSVVHVVTFTLLFTIYIYIYI